MKNLAWSILFTWSASHLAAALLLLLLVVGA